MKTLAGMAVLGLVSLGLVTFDILRPWEAQEEATVLPEQRVEIQPPSKRETAKPQPKRVRPQTKRVEPANRRASVQRVPTGHVAQKCVDRASREERLACFDTYFRHQKPNQPTYETFARRGAWRINTRRTSVSEEGRVLIRTANTTSPDADTPGHSIAHLYAACRAGRQSLWFDFEDELTGRFENIPVEFSVDGAPFTTSFLNASKRRTAVGVWQDDAARDLLQTLAEARSVRVRAVHNELATRPAEFNTAGLARALETFQVACP